MTPRHTEAERRRRRQAPTVEGLEGRALLSTGAGASQAATALIAAAAFAGGNGGAAVGGATTAGVPTPREAAREHYASQFIGSYVIGPGRFTDQAASIRFEATGRPHYSNQTNSNLQMLLLTPLDDVKGRTQGATAIFARNVATSGTSLLLAVEGAAPTGPGGLPTELTWMVDPASGGAYASVGPFGNGSGTITIKYIPSGKLPAGATGAGRALISIVGTINTGGIFNPVFGPHNTPKHP